MPKKLKKLGELFHDGLKDIYFAEKKILVALPKMAKAAESEELANAFEEHEMQTKEQVSRLEKVFQLIDETPRGKNCPAITGIIDEGEEIIDEYEDSPALDAGLIGAAQAVEHYEIARYGTLKAWARNLASRRLCRCSTKLSPKKKAQMKSFQILEKARLIKERKPPR